MGIIIHSLESVSFKDLYAAFSSAFKDYDFSLNADELRRMLDRRGYNPQPVSYTHLTLPTTERV